MVSKSVDAKNFEMCFALRYCMIYKEYSNSVYCSISATLQCISCFFFLEETRLSFY